MRQRYVPCLAFVFGLAALAAAASPAVAMHCAGGGPAANSAAPPGPAAAATAYLEARAAAVTAADPGAALAPWLASGAAPAAHERTVARGEARRAAELGHLLDAVTGQVTVADVAVAPGGASAKVRAHVVTTTSWHAATMEPSRESSGIDHVVSLALVNGAWKVTGDVYADDQVPAFLEAAGASQGVVRRAARRLEQASQRTPVGPVRAAWRVRARGRRYADIITYDRDAARDYADRYALSYNPAYVAFGADCANFASQSARAGSMPVTSGTVDSGWWYDRNGTSGTGDDKYSMSWINVTRQNSFWNGRRADWVASINDLGRGDFVYYDWSGDGVWDHAAVVTGTNSAGQKVVDAHTTDYLHAFWKMGYSSTKYRFARVRSQWVV